MIERPGESVQFVDAANAAARRERDQVGAFALGASRSGRGGRQSELPRRESRARATATDGGRR